MGFTLAGVVAGEGCFFSTRRLPAFADGSERRRFVFSMTMVQEDRPLLEALQQFLGVGSLRDEAARKDRWQPTTAFQVGSHRQLHERVIPFGETFLIATNKRAQFEAWRDEFYAYEASHPSKWGKGLSTCSVDGCGRPVRGRGVCRSHYHQLTGY